MAGLDRRTPGAARSAAIGHGDRHEMTPAQALEIAKAAEPARLRRS